MKYFTPELYRRGNSDDDAEVDAVELEWHEAIQQHRKYLRKIAKRVPPELLRLSSKMCLHDGEIIGLTKSSVTVWIGGVLVSVEFQLDQSAPRPKWGPAIAGHPFDTSGHCWLYDELEEIEPGVFLFEVLISNGKILRFRCRNVVIWEVAERNGTNPSNGAAHPPLTLPKLRELVLASSAKSPRAAKSKTTAKQDPPRRTKAKLKSGSATSRTA